MTTDDIETPQELIAAVVDIDQRLAGVETSAQTLGAVVRLIALITDAEACGKRLRELQKVQSDAEKAQKELSKREIYFNAETAA
jgi:hypothetical protein